MIAFYNRDITLYSPVVTICTTSLTFKSSKFCPCSVCVLCGSQNKQRILPFTALIYNRDGVCLLRGRAESVKNRYVSSLNIKDSFGITALRSYKQDVFCNPGPSEMAQTARLLTYVWGTDGRN